MVLNFIAKKESACSFSASRASARPKCERCQEAAQTDRRYQECHRKDNKNTGTFGEFVAPSVMDEMTGSSSVHPIVHPRAPTIDGVRAGPRAHETKITLAGLKSQQQKAAREEVQRQIRSRRRPAKRKRSTVRPRSSGDQRNANPAEPKNTAWQKLHNSRVTPN